MQPLIVQEGGHKDNGRQSPATSWASYDGQKSSSEGCSSSDEGDNPEKRKRHKHDRSSKNQTDNHKDDVDELSGRSKAESEPGANVARLFPESDDENLEILMTIDKELNQEEKRDKPVSDTLTSIINKRWQAKMPSEKLKEVLDKYGCRPENCQKLVVPRVNAQIWNKLKRTYKMTDLRMSHIQESTVKAAIAVTKCTEQWIKNNARDEGFDLQMHGVTDALALLGNASYEMSLMRHTMLKPALNKKYVELCSPQVPITAWLFGDDLIEQLKISKKTSEIGSFLTRKTVNSHRPYKKNTHKAYRYKP